MSKSRELMVKPSDSHHFIPVTPPVLSSDQKIAKKQLALWRKSIKTAKEERMIDAGREAGIEIIRGLGGEISNIGKGIADAHGQMFRGWLGNTDPITWAAGGVAMVVYVTFITNMVRQIGKTLHISDDLAADIGLNYLTDNLPTTVGATVSNIVGRDDANGTFGIATLDFNGFYKDFRWYTNSTSRDAALVLLNTPGSLTITLVSGSFPLYVPVMRPAGGLNPGAGNVTPDSPGTQLSRIGKWVVTWISGAETKNVPLPVVVGVFTVYSDALEAQKEQAALGRTTTITGGPLV